MMMRREANKNRCSDNHDVRDFTTWKYFSPEDYRKRNSSMFLAPQEKAVGR